MQIRWIWSKTKHNKQKKALDQKADKPSFSQSRNEALGMTAMDLTFQ